MLTFKGMTMKKEDKVTDKNTKLAIALLKKAKQLKRVTILTALLGGTGCTGLGARAEIYRIDDRSEQTASKHIPLKCLFINCAESGGEK